MAIYIRDMGHEMNTMSRPTRLLDQHFAHGLAMEDILAPLTAVPGLKPYLREGYCRPWRVHSNDIGSVIRKGDDKFHVSLDVQQFKPEEITVKVTDKHIVVEGEHEEREDEHGFVTRHFLRRYILPEGYELKNVVSKLSSDGVLGISAPKVTPKEVPEKLIPIIHTGPHKIEAVKVDADKEKKSI